MTTKRTPQMVSKSEFKPRALEFFRQVESTGCELVITDHGRPVLRLTPYVDSTDEIMRRLQHSVLQYDDPTEPVDVAAWEALG